MLMSYAYTEVGAVWPDHGEPYEYGTLKKNERREKD